MSFATILGYCQQQPQHDVNFWSLRLHAREDEFVKVRRGQPLPPHFVQSTGYMITVFHNGGTGYAGSADLSPAGVKEAWNRAKRWANWSSQKAVCSFDPGLFSEASGVFRADQSDAPQPLSIKDRIDWLQNLNERMNVSPEVIDRNTSLWCARVRSHFASSLGSRQEQIFQFISPQLSATANRGAVTEQRSYGGAESMLRQTASSHLGTLKLEDVAVQLAHESVELVASPVCPTTDCDVILLPDQMILQLHESIGHPIELDRILGDERNYAGTSFVTPDMFGTFAYGSKILNVVFDPGLPGEAACYEFDDDGVRATREYLIKDGILLRGLGSAVSQKRSGLPGVACARASSWNRAPIDRMANINIEPGTESLQQLIGKVDSGVLMGTNCSWSIDDSRNKFQFGCEWGRIIKGGQLGHLVRKPNYRGVSSQFWHSLASVGGRTTMDVLGTPYCGKGEPNQAITVGHATPACHFQRISVFGD